MDQITDKDNVSPSSKSNWDICFEKAQEFRAETGGWRIPVKYVTEDGYQLGMWCHNVRKRYVNGQLTQDRIDRLISIGFEFEKPFNISWNTYYSAAKDYYKKNGHLSIPMGYETEDGLRLDRWVGQQRLAVSTGKISAYRKAKLERVGIYLTRSETAFDRGLSHIKAYVERNGNADVPMGYICDDGYNLGNWVMLQRQLYSNGKLTDRKINTLKELNFHWRYNDAIWEENYKEALEYYKRNGNLDSLFSSDNDRPIGQWLAVQRMKYRKGELSNEQIKLLEDIGVVWNPSQETWSRNYGLIKEYYISHGHHVGSSYFIGGYAVGKWLKTQQIAYNDGKLSVEQRCLLEEINAVPTRPLLKIITENSNRHVGDVV